MRAKKISTNLSYKKHQRGMALLLLLLVFGSGALYLLLSSLNQNSLQTERNQKTAEALALAKQALIGSAVSMQLLTGTSSTRPGDLPCPDLNNDGSSEASCGSASGGSQSTRLGRLPWKRLDLPDLRDGYGERLWYAVSNNFKNSTRHEPLNSNTFGTITVRDAAGNITHNGSDATGAIAVIFAPGPPISRLGVPQLRAGPGVNDPRNYLDSANGEDNADFVDGTLNGFIQRDTNPTNNITMNDQLSIISHQDLIPLINKRVKGELSLCPANKTCSIAPTNPNGWWVRNDWQSIPLP